MDIFELYYTIYIYIHESVYASLPCTIYIYLYSNASDSYINNHKQFTINIIQNFLVCLHIHVACAVGYMDI